MYFVSSTALCRVIPLVTGDTIVARGLLSVSPDSGATVSPIEIKGIFRETGAKHGICHAARAPSTVTAGPMVDRTPGMSTSINRKISETREACSTSRRKRQVWAPRITLRYLRARGAFGRDVVERLKVLAPLLHQESQNRAALPGALNT
jgi:hypothetical protein